MKNMLLAGPVTPDEVKEESKSGSSMPQTGLNDLIAPSKTKKQVQFTFEDTLIIDKDVPVINGVNHGKFLKFAPSSIGLMKKHQESTTNYSQIEKDASYFLRVSTPRSSSEILSQTRESSNPPTEFKHNQIYYEDD